MINSDFINWPVKRVSKADVSSSDKRQTLETSAFQTLLVGQLNTQLGIELAGLLSHLNPVNVIYMQANN